MISVEAFAQNGPSGCITACLANVARHLLQENVTPHTVDMELSREPAQDLTTYQRDRWLLERGLSVTLIGQSFPEFDAYLREEATFEVMAVATARRYFDGNMPKTLSYLSMPEYQQQLGRLRVQYETHVAALQRYESLGRYKEVLREAADQDIQEAAKIGAVVLYSTTQTELIGHQELLVTEATDPTYGSVYVPGIERGTIFGVDLEDGLIPGYIDPDEIVVVSRQL